MEKFTVAERRAGAFTLRVNMPCSNRDRVDLTVNYPSGCAFRQWMNCTHTRALSVNPRAHKLASAPRARKLETDVAAQRDLGLSEGQRLANKRQETLEMLEGVRPQHKMRDYSGQFKAELEQFAREEIATQTLLAKSREVHKLDWLLFYSMITNGLPEIDRRRFPPNLGKRLKPILLQLSPHTEGHDPVDRVCGARNLQGMVMPEFAKLMAEVARGGWRNHVLWVCDPEEGFPCRIERNFWNPLPVDVSDNFF